MLITLDQLKTSLQAMKNFVIQHIPTKVSELTNDSNFTTKSYVDEEIDSIQNNINNIDFSDRIANGTGEASIIIGDIENNAATGDYSYAEGYHAQSWADYSHTEGYETIASGYGAHAEGYNTTASFLGSHSEGCETIASSDNAHAEGYQTNASGESSHAEGSNTIASAFYSHAEGYGSEASQETAHAEGSSTQASGYHAHSEGNSTTASGDSSHAEGSSTIASGTASHAEGAETTASGELSHAEGNATTASGENSHTEGYYTLASGDSSHAEGHSTIANHADQHVFGTYNIADTSNASAWDHGNYIEIVGNGTIDNLGEPVRSNARTLDWNGNETLAGKLTVGSNPTSNMDVTTKEYVDNLISNITQFSFQVVQTLPVTGEAGVIYLVAHSHGTGDIYDEYIWTGNAYEKIGNTDIDLSNYVTNTDYATNNTAGVVKISNSIGMLPTGEIGIISASNSDIKAGISTTNAITPGNQHRSIFYGLAKAAGDVTQSSSDNAVGLYTEEAKGSIKSMLGIVDGGSGVYIGTTAPTGSENVWIDTSGNPDTDSQGIVDLQGKINQVRNLQAPAILSDTYSGTTLSTVSVNIPAGTYTLEVESLTSADEDTELNLVTFIWSGGSLSVKLSRGLNIQKKVTFKGDVTTMYLYASDSYAHSVGDAFSFTGLKLIAGYPLKDGLDDLSQTVQGLSGRYSAYETGNRTFIDNTLAYIGADNTIVLGGNSPNYAVYKYKITETTSFNVTGSTRGGSNYLAIATDDSGICVQTIEPGVPSTTTSYSNFQFTIDNPGATTVYICLYKQPTDDVRIKLNRDMKELSILFVGNSLTQDGIAYLPYLLTKYYPGFRFRFYMWYNGGYDLSQQYAKFTADTECEAFSVAENSPTWTTTTEKMSDILSVYKFNIVCMQEYFNRKVSYTDTDLTDWNNCRDYIVSHYMGGNALEFISLFHSPWLTDEQSVYDLTKTGNALILKKTIADDMIATGIALHMARSTDLDSLGDQGHLTPDSVHAQEGLPCLLETYTALLWVLDRYGFPTSIYGLPFKMTAGIQSGIAVPGANVGTGVIEGTDAQNLLAQEVAVMAYKMGKKFVVDNLVPTL